MKKVLFLFLSIFFLSCSVEDINPTPCVGECQAYFTIDIIQNPGSYLDSQGVWHVKYSGLNYFRIKGQTSSIKNQYLINGVPSIITSFDSNYFYIPNQVTWTYPVYSFLGLFSNNNLSQPILIGNQTYTLPQLINNTSVSNLAGYEINKKFNFSHPSADLLLQTYSKYNYTPTQHMVFFPQMINHKADIYIKVIFAPDWYGVYQEKFYKLSIIFED